MIAGRREAVAGRSPNSWDGVLKSRDRVRDARAGLRLTGAAPYLATGGAHS